MTGGNARGGPSNHSQGPGVKVSKIGGAIIFKIKQEEYEGSLLEFQLQPWPQKTKSQQSRHLPAWTDGNSL